MKRALVLLLAACGDNTHPIDAPLAPDLTLVASQMNNSPLVITDTFGSADCAVVEGCAVPGTRKLLTFDTVSENIGTADLVLGQVPPPGVSSGIFVWSPCHMHHHVMGYADFALLDASGVVASGHKQGFCLEDDEQVSPANPTHGYNCSFQGISIGWADVYDRTLPCQWIDVTDVAPGTYTLRVEIDPTGVVPDSDPTNNVWMTTVTLL